jgi:PilZ domain
VSLFASSVPSRRLTTRLPATWDVWVYWECSGFSDVSHVRDLSTGGIFIETPRRRTKGDLVQVHFLVPEGQISVDGVVAHEQPAMGIGLKFQTVATKDVAKLTALLERLRSASRGLPEPHSFSDSNF